MSRNPTTCIKRIRIQRHLLITEFQYTHRTLIYSLRGTRTQRPYTTYSRVTRYHRSRFLKYDAINAVSMRVHAGSFGFPSVSRASWILNYADYPAMLQCQSMHWQSGRGPRRHSSESLTAAELCSAISITIQCHRTQPRRQPTT